jgi:hypothetical protein
MVVQLFKGGEFNAASACEQKHERGPVPAQSWNSSNNQHLSVVVTRSPLSVVARIFPRPSLFFSHQAPAYCAVELPHEIIQTRIPHVQER